MSLLEVCCFSPESAIIASEAGADRIELCDSQHAGGTTPAAEWLARVKSKVTIPVFVMIRPRGGHFNFSDAEFQRMKADIDELKPAADGFVFGILDDKREIDVGRTAQLVRRAAPLPCTFHKAFDETPDPLQALEDVIATGCHSLLSSGGASAGVGEGLTVLRAMVQRAQERIMVMPGGGVRSSNLARVQAATGAFHFHSSAMHKDSSSPDAEEIRLMKQMNV
ncbi:hypothetical protein M409DRAFT_63367 [Zasmidium cellare ATCC 36951]|uniref:Copper homeostasis protein cutC homolog n=1 Tax=Zasmidium cellare ATCC 36951 TaxID=1080233 RepID=A0A6A6CXA1_ZASCE|nr:uncharacterized protein M409DRAFT_63367 [Zasmidium cellare ATCC 36951]KAF2171784.1 hypothetical protein M409DRAFT_63367 [Zasmidium cellare ATCC 36951]